MTSNGSQIDHAIIEYAGGDAEHRPAQLRPVRREHQPAARHIAALLVGDGSDRQYVPPAGLITHSIFRNNTGNFAIDSVWEAAGFGPALDRHQSVRQRAEVLHPEQELHHRRLRRRPASTSRDAWCHEGRPVHPTAALAIDRHGRWRWRPA